MQTCEGGIGLRKLQDINKAMLMKLAWSIVEKKGTWAAYMRGKYFEKNEDPINYYKKSSVRRGIKEAYMEIKKQSKWIAANGGEVKGAPDSLARRILQNAVPTDERVMLQQFRLSSRNTYVQDLWINMVIPTLNNIRSTRNKISRGEKLPLFQCVQMKIMKQVQLSAINSKEGIQVEMDLGLCSGTTMQQLQGSCNLSFQRRHHAMAVCSKMGSLQDQNADKATWRETNFSADRAAKRYLEFALVSVLLGFVGAVYFFPFILACNPGLFL
ncbi:hypothetical protein GIB67_027731 [Kingdonia uniflora]|uniref:Uncharacterized protein n=1 Tax=Kingdonia uniflora TaxID=39325 RepID=A0A7J7PBV9_9MAGN|nr:hypothetical protein GIB67_027731 [Kingdonia uniflora]